MGNIYAFQQPVFELWIREFIIDGSSSIVDFVAILLYNLWSARNRIIFNDVDVVPMSIIAASSRTLADFKEARGWPESPSPALTDISLRRPSRCWRIYFDGAISIRRNCSGAGVWIQAPSDDFVRGICHRFDHTTDPTMAEFLALRAAVSTAMELKLTDFTIIGDALEVIQCLADPSMCPAVAAPVLDDIHSTLAANSVVVKPCWISRGLNHVAHQLAYHAKNMDVYVRTWSEFPNFVVSISAG